MTAILVDLDTDKVAHAGPGKRRVARHGPSCSRRCVLLRTEGAVTREREIDAGRKHAEATRRGKR